MSHTTERMYDRARRSLRAARRMRLALLAVSIALAIAGCGSGGDEVTCSSDSDCDPDEVCSNGMCTGQPDPCTSNAEHLRETCVNGNCQ